MTYEVWFLKDLVLKVQFLNFSNIDIQLVAVASSSEIVVEILFHTPLRL
jgi:hypothetical protein